MLKIQLYNNDTDRVVLRFYDVKGGTLQLANILRISSSERKTLFRETITACSKIIPNCCMFIRIKENPVKLDFQLFLF